MSDTWDGLPQNPERDGWHWVRRYRGAPIIALHWFADWSTNADRGWGKFQEPDRMDQWEYHGPCLTPAEIAAREQAAFERGHEAALDNDDRLLARPDIAAIRSGLAVAAPREALPEMLAAWWRQKNTGTQEIGKTGHEISDSAAYRAMLAAYLYAPLKESAEIAERELTFSALARISRARCEAADGFNQPLASWSGSDWFTAVLGELGEAANVAKKLNRARDGIVGNQDVSEAELHRRLAEELADTVIYLDLLAQHYNINLGHAVASKFNATSRKLGITHRLPEPPKESDDEHAGDALRYMGHIAGAICLTPAEVTALRAAREQAAREKALREAAAEVAKHGWRDGPPHGGPAGLYAAGRKDAAHHIEAAILALIDGEAAPDAKG